MLAYCSKIRASGPAGDEVYYVRVRGAPPPAGPYGRGGEARRSPGGDGNGGQVSPRRSRVEAFKTAPGPEAATKSQRVGCAPGNKVLHHLPLPPRAPGTWTWYTAQRSQISRAGFPVPGCRLGWESNSRQGRLVSVVHDLLGAARGWGKGF